MKTKMFTRMQKDKVKNQREERYKKEMWLFLWYFGGSVASGLSWTSLSHACAARNSLKFLGLWAQTLYFLWEVFVTEVAEKLWVKNERVNVVWISGRNDKQGFPMKQGILTYGSVPLLLSKEHKTRRTEQRKHKSVQGYTVNANFSVPNLVIVKKKGGVGVEREKFLVSLILLL